MKLTKIFGAIAAAALAITSLAIPTSAEGGYHAYIGVQSASYTFRNSWDDGTYGKGIVADDGTVWFDQLTGWDGPTALNKGGDFTDVEITGDGTYKVGVTNFDFGSDETFNLLFVSTDIPVDCGITISDVKVIMDGNTVYTFEESYNDPESKTYIKPTMINIWNDDLGKADGLFGYMMPSSSIEVEFTVSGFTAPAAPAADTAETESATTGNAPVAATVAVLAVAGTAAIASRKRK